MWLCKRNAERKSGHGKTERTKEQISQSARKLKQDSRQLTKISKELSEKPLQHTHKRKTIWDSQRTKAHKKKIEHKQGNNSNHYLWPSTVRSCGRVHNIRYMLQMIVMMVCWWFTGNEHHIWGPYSEWSSAALLHPSNQPNWRCCCWCFSSEFYHFDIVRKCYFFFFFFIISLLRHLKTVCCLLHMQRFNEISPMESSQTDAIEQTAE